MRGSFEQLKNYLEGRFPEIKVRGENHPPTAVGKFAMNMASVTQIVCTVLAFGGEHVFAMLGLDRTPLGMSIMDNKLQLLGFSFLFNSVAQSLAKTDAFEIFVNGDLIFSKLDKKRMPTLDELLTALAERGVAIPSHGGISRKPAQSQQM